jgi:outer membrane protein assembly factor BamA
MPNLAVGLGFQYDNHYHLSIAESQIFTDNPEISTNSISSGLTFPIVYDSRKNIVNPQNGLYSSLTFRFNSPTFGSDHHWNSIFLDIRKYYSIPNTRSVLSFRSYYWSVLSGEVPYFDLPSTQSEPTTGMASRGIKKNRFRSNAMLFLESEYRFNITKNGFVGGVLFSNVTTTSQYDSQCFKYWKPSVGTGILLKFNKYTKVNVALDFGISKEYSTVYLNIGEAF